MKVNGDEEDVIVKLVKNEPQKPDATQEDLNQCPSSTEQKVCTVRPQTLDLLVLWLATDPFFRSRGDGKKI